MLPLNEKTPCSHTMLTPTAKTQCKHSMAVVECEHSMLTQNAAWGPCYGVIEAVRALEFRALPPMPLISFKKHPNERKGVGGRGVSL